MKKRRFIKSLFACAAIAFAEPLLCIIEKKWIPNLAYQDAEYEIHWLVAGKSINIGLPPLRFRADKDGVLKEVSSHVLG